MWGRRPLGTGEADAPRRRRSGGGAAAARCLSIVLFLRGPGHSVGQPENGIAPLNAAARFLEDVLPWPPELSVSGRVSEVDGVEGAGRCSLECRQPLKRCRSAARRG